HVLRHLRHSPHHEERRREREHRDDEQADDGLELETGSELHGLARKNGADRNCRRRSASAILGFRKNDTNPPKNGAPPSAGRRLHRRTSARTSGDTGFTSTSTPMK